MFAGRELFMNVARLLMCAVGCWLLPGQPAAACDRSPILVRNVDVWSPEGVQHERDVLVAEGRVQAITGPRRGRTPAGTREIDARGATLLPGLIDSHLHLSYNGWRAPPDSHRWGSAIFTGPQNLSAGVTNGRIHLIDMKTGAMLRRDSQDDCAPLPRLQSAGPAFIPGAPVHHDAAAWSVTGIDDAIDRVNREKAAGFEWIAFHEFHKFGAGEREAIVRTARENGMRLLGSGFTQDEVESSLAVRPDTIDYLDTTAAPEYAPRLVDAARAQPTLIWVARLGIHLRRQLYQQNPALAEAPGHYVFVPEADVPALRAFTRAELENTGSEYSRRMSAAYPTLRRKFQQLRASGITLAAGTDAGSPNHPPSDAIWWELRSWVEFGATPAEALKAVTVNGAKVLNRDDLGAIRTGAVGDFVIYRGDVMDGDFDVARVTHVAKGGVLFVDAGRWIGPGPTP
jgi:imidazolonepropionase-like amidohydrolase